MDFSEYHPAVLAIAADSLGFSKSINLNEDGTLEWYGEETHPNDEEILAAIPTAQIEFDNNKSRYGVL